MAKEELKIVIPAPNIKQMAVRIKGLSPIIFNKWSEKAKNQMRDKQAMKPKAPREARDPQAEYLNSFYYDLNGNISFPALAIKNAIVGAARSIEGITMVELRGSVFPLGDMDDMVPLLVNDQPIRPSTLDVEGDFPANIIGTDVKTPQIQAREDMVTVGMGSADLRYRGQVKDWEMTFMVRFNAGKLSPEQILNLLQYAGFSQGLGEWRPEKNGNSGTFEVKSTSEEALK